MLYFKTDMKNKMKNLKLKLIYLYMQQKTIINFDEILLKFANFFLFFNMNLRKLGFNIELGPI